MNDTVAKFRPRLHSKKFGTRFPRLERANKTVAPEHISEELAPYYPPPSDPDGWVYACTKDAPFENYELEYEFESTDVLYNVTPSVPSAPR